MRIKLLRRQFLQTGCALALASIACTALARAQVWPNRVVRMIVGYTPGGGADLAARIVSGGLSEIWGRQVIVENKPGAGARIALDAVAHAARRRLHRAARARPPEVNRFLISKLTFDPVADLAPVSLIGTFPDIVAVPNSSAFKSLGEFSLTPKPIPARSAGHRKASVRCHISPANCSSIWPVSP